MTDLRIPVLVLEDNPVDRAFLMAALKHMPVDVHHVMTVRDAVEKLKTADFAVVITDLQLPDGQGAQTIRALAALHDSIVVVTASTQADAIEAIREGADDFVQKGSHPEIIRHAVQCAMERRFRRQAKATAKG